MNFIMKDDLVELVVHLNWNCVEMGSNLGLDKVINFLFINSSFGKNVKGQEKP